MQGEQENRYLMSSSEYITHSAKYRNSLIARYRCLTLVS